MDLTIKIIWIILAICTLFTVYIIARKFAMILNSKNLMMRDIAMYKMKFSEQEILTHLDYIIDEYLTYYITMYITPKNIYYITNPIETEIVKKLSETVPARISPTLYSQLSLIYDSNQIANVIGEKIYTKVLEFVLQFNIQNKNKKDDKLS